jgi:ferrous iron transport protein B
MEALLDRRDARNRRIEALLDRAERLRDGLDGRIHERMTEAAFSFASKTAGQCIHSNAARDRGFDLKLDRLLTSRIIGLPLMLVLLGLVFWITIEGANVPSAFLAGVLMEEGGLTSWLQTYFSIENTPFWLSHSLYDGLGTLFVWMNAPLWLTGFLVDGIYLGLAWVVSVMLPPMAIFFPLFTLLEDFGYLPRVAFNMDRFFRAVGAHGKQALTMAMGFGCNAAGVVACRIIESPRERLIALLTNNFVPCNGRWPTLIMVSSLFVAASLPSMVTSLATVAALIAVTLIGIGATLAVSLFLSKTVLKGVASSFVLEMPPYRPPQVGRVLYTSFIDRTLFVLWRAVVCAAPAGGLIWLLGSVSVGDASLFEWLRSGLDPVGRTIGLDGVILIAFIFAIPANEIVVPTIIMGYMQGTKMVELDNPTALFINNGWTLTTAVCLMLFSLLHYPCTTTTLTIWKETRSIKWTVLANVIPLVLAVVVCFAVAQIARVFGIS